MSHSKPETDGTLVTHAPLFASVWLALFSQLRKNYSERQIELDAKAKRSKPARN
ncbi:MAG: hypothetical protein HKP21_07860 [Xanthomonadales bacterium]|nr:hypothetical protein [Gammaproteobacteria bacterium]MBT8073611.1 hypothetical protein [Gammaproteobacteria bacterium]MBT8075584.1 hypothetical protein [Gammaproteobacteria bacterium]NNK04453.1 hypothetical protein [Xanthomonadales bacterium]NNK98724.1 hypothetical protein [Xanthomonadales bacterium]